MPAANPTARLLAPDGSVVATSLNGLGLTAVLPQSGTYRIAVRSDNSAGQVTGSYVGNLNVVTAPLVDSEPGPGLAEPAPWGVAAAPSRAVGMLSDLSDVDMFFVTLSVPGTYAFQLESPAPGLSTQAFVVSRKSRSAVPTPGPLLAGQATKSSQVWARS